MICFYRVLNCRGFWSKKVHSVYFETWGITLLKLAPNHNLLYMRVANPNGNNWTLFMEPIFDLILIHNISRVIILTWHFLLDFPLGFINLLHLNKYWVRLPFCNSSWYHWPPAESQHFGWKQSLPIIFEQNMVVNYVHYAYILAQPGNEDSYLRWCIYCKLLGYSRKWPVCQADTYKRAVYSNGIVWIIEYRSRKYVHVCAWSLDSTPQVLTWIYNDGVIDPAFLFYY